MSDLNQGHFKVVSDFLTNNVGTSASYMLTIARDGESPARSIYFFSNALDASEAYNRYNDWGFAKEYLTVSLYEPGNKITTKVLNRPKAGECTFVRSDYIKAEEILLSVKNEMTEEAYTKLIKEFAGLFSRDNIRFDVSRFFAKTECEEVNE